MRIQAEFGMMMIFAAALLIGMAIFYFYNVAIVPQIKSSTDVLVGLTTSRVGQVKQTVSACQAWRSPQSFYDPAALSQGIIEPINSIFPQMQCSQDSPLSCEETCACLYKLAKYCRIGEPGSSASGCLAEPCRVVVEG